MGGWPLARCPQKALITSQADEPYSCMNLCTGPLVVDKMTSKKVGLITILQWNLKSQDFTYLRKNIPIFITKITQKQDI